MELNELGFKLVENQKMLDGNSEAISNLLKLHHNAHLNEALFIWQQPKRWETGEEKNKRAEAIYVFSGKVTLIISKKRIVLTAGNILYIRENTSYEIEQLQLGDILIRISFPSNYFPQLKQEVLTNSTTIDLLNILQNQLESSRFLLFKCEKLNDPSYIVERIICEYYSPDTFTNISIRAKFTLLIVELFRGNYLSLEKEIINQKTFNLFDCLEYIDINFQKINLTNMATFFNYHPHYLSQKLKEKTGRTFMELVTIKKMTIALILLENPRLSVNEIAEYIGYSSISFFYKKFKIFFGKTPKDMRNNLLKEQ